MSDIVRYDRIGDIALLTADNPPVNALGHAVRVGLMTGFDRALADGAAAIVMTCAGRTWHAGADIREFGKPPVDPWLPEVCNVIEACPVPVIAALHGTALGGGLEVAMAAHYRIAVPTTRVGLPEVHLGILPGAGGTQRLPRLAGLGAAVDIITTGRQVAADEALSLGIVDRVSEGNPRELGLAYARELLSHGAGPRPTRNIPSPDPVDFDALYNSVLKKGRGQLSPATAVRAIQAACELPFDDGLASERQLFQQLMETDQRKGLIHAFFAERQVGKLPELSGVTPGDIWEIGVIGGGTMGAGIATTALLSGLKVTLIEMSEEAVKAAKARIDGNLQGALKRGKITPQAYEKMIQSALILSSTYDDLVTADVIIEAVFEDMAVKKQVFARIDAVAKPGAVLATNTSYLNINEIAAATSRAADVIGLHFFSPAHIMKLLEVVVADKTAPEVTATGFTLGKTLKKVAVRAGVCDGFIGNRILTAYRTAADHMVLDGASPHQIDAALEAFGFAMGPFAVADLAGLDIGWANRRRLAATRDPRERIPTYADKLCEAGHFGQKTGRGYYIHNGGTRIPNPKVLELIAEEREQRGITPREFSDSCIVQRYMNAMVNEAAKVVDEGIARRPLDVDMVLIFGYGFPRYHGGPMKWADMQGLDQILNEIKILAQHDSFVWQPAPLLEKLVAKKQCFEDLNNATAQ